MTWGKARKKPIEVDYREPIPSGREAAWEGKVFKVEWVRTLEGYLYAKPGRDFVIRGIKGELYPIRKDIFKETYDVVSPIMTKDDTK